MAGIGGYKYIHDCAGRGPAGRRKSMRIYFTTDEGKEVTFEELLEIQKQYDKEHEGDEE